MTPEQKARVSIDALLVLAGRYVCGVADANLYVTSSRTGHQTKICTHHLNTQAFGLLICSGTLD